jgi:HAD superfamily hydrolase (TIGR01549 family)
MNHFKSSKAGLWFDKKEGSVLGFFSMDESLKQQTSKSLGISWSERRIEGIVFDVDGTLTNSIEAYYEVFREVTAQFGIQVRKEDVLEPMATGSLIWDRILPKDLLDRDEKIKQFMKVILQVYEKAFQNVHPFDGLESVLKRLEEQGVRLGAVTSAREVAVRPLYRHALSQYFKAIITREDGFLLKPAPDAILECLRRMEVSSDHAIIVGDSPLDIRAGKTAGSLTIGVLSGIGSQAQLEAEAPTAIIKHVSQLLSLLNVQ